MLVTNWMRQAGKEEQWWIGRAWLRHFVKHFGAKVKIMSEKALLKLVFFFSFFSTRVFPHNFSFVNFFAKMTSF